MLLIRTRAAGVSVLLAATAMTVGAQRITFAGGAELALASARDLSPGACSTTYPVGLFLSASRPIRFVNLTASVRPHAWKADPYCQAIFQSPGSFRYRDTDYLTSRPFTTVDLRADVRFPPLTGGRLSLGGGAFTRSGRDLGFGVIGLATAWRVGSASMRVGVDAYLVHIHVNLVERTTDSTFAVTSRPLGTERPWEPVWGLHASIGAPVP